MKKTDYSSNHSDVSFCERNIAMIGALSSARPLAALLEVDDGERRSFPRAPRSPGRSITGRPHHLDDGKNPAMRYAYSGAAALRAASNLGG
jgi:hypothetical protein